MESKESKRARISEAAYQRGSYTDSSPQRSEEGVLLSFWLNTDVHVCERKLSKGKGKKGKQFLKLIQG